MENNNQYDEISLRELIDNLLKNKKLIAIITIVVLALAFVYTFLISDEIYEAKTTVQINQGDVTSATVPSDVADILDNMSLYSSSTMETYKEQILSPNVMVAVIAELSLDEMAVENLSNKISISNNKDSNLITIKVTDTDKAHATALANSVAKQFSLYISSVQELQLSKSTEILETQLESERVTLDEALNELKVLLSESRDASAIQNEIFVNVETLNSYTSKYATLDSSYEDTKFNLEESINKSKGLISALEALLLSIDETFVVDKSILNDTFATQLSSSVSGSLAEIMQLKISDEEINPIYVDTLSKLVAEQLNIINNEETLLSITRVYEHDKYNLLKNIEKYEKLIDGLKAEFAERELEERIIQRKVDTSQQTYDAFGDKLELTRVVEAAKISENNIVVISTALEPNFPIAPNKSLNLAIGGVLGLMLAVFVAFFKEYWINSKPQ